MNDNALLQAQQKSKLGDELPPFGESVESDSFHLQRALTDGICKQPGRELYVRMAIWWAANDRFRPLLEDSDGIESCRLLSATVARSPTFIENQNLLLPLLDTSDPRELILKAEIYRELGEFDECISLLDSKAEFFRLHHQIEYAQDSLRRHMGREEMGEFAENPIFDWSPKAENLLRIADLVLKYAADGDVVVRPL